MIRARKIFSAARALPTTVSCITGMEPESQALARRVGPVESLVKHDPALRGPEPRLRCVPPTANICGGFGIFTSGRARAPRPDGGGRAGDASSSRLGRERSLWATLGPSRRAPRACASPSLSPVGGPGLRGRGCFHAHAVHRRHASAAPFVPPCSFPCVPLTWPAWCVLSRLKLSLWSLERLRLGPGY